METTVLYMYFIDEVGGKKSISLPEPRIDLTEEEVKTAMITILTNNVFTNKTFELTAIHSAQIVTRSVNELELE